MSETNLQLVGLLDVALQALLCFATTLLYKVYTSKSSQVTLLFFTLLSWHAFDRSKAIRLA